MFVPYLRIRDASNYRYLVIPAKAGIHAELEGRRPMDSRLRGNDKCVEVPCYLVGYFNACRAPWCAAFVFQYRLGKTARRGKWECGRN
jgi:hypothetical protein